MSYQKRVEKGELKPSTNNEMKKTGGFTIRSIIVGLVSMVLVGFHGLYGIFTNSYDALGMNSFPTVGGLLFVCLILLHNSIIKRYRFSPREIATVYIMHLISGTVYLQVLGFSVVNIAALGALYLEMPARYTSVFESFSPWIVIKDIDAIMDFWIGNGKVPWLEWLKPIFVWTLFWSILFWIFICISTIVRHMWTDRERLRYPLVVPVTELVTLQNSASDTIPIWKNKYIWIAAAIVFVFQTSGFISSLFPGVPQLPTRIPIGAGIDDPPWSILQEWPALDIVINFSAIGISYFISVDMLFSLWFFYLMINKAIPIILHSIGGPDYAWANFNMVIQNAMGRGAFLGVLATLLWFMRHEIKIILLKAIGYKKHNVLPDCNEPLSFPMAVWSGLMGFVAISLFSIYLLQIDVLVYMVYIIIFLLVSLGFARLRAEAGTVVPIPGTLWMQYDVRLAFGSENMGTSTLYSLGVFFNPMHEGYAGLGIANALDAYKLGDTVNLRRRSVTFVMIIAFVVTIISGYRLLLPLIYDKGMFNLESYYVHHGGMGVSMIGGEVKPELMKIAGAYLGGSAAAILFMVLRTQIIWWPIHPLGLAIAPNTFMSLIWGSLFIGWLIKTLMLRYAGVDSIKRVYPFFLSLILSSAIISGFYGVIRWLMAVIPL